MLPGGEQHMSKERPKEAGECFGKQHSHEPCATGAVSGSGIRRRADRAGVPSEKGECHEDQLPKSRGGRLHKRWRIRVVRIDVQKYPDFAGDKDHPFAGMAADARVEEMDSFFARLRARRKSLNSEGGGLSAAA